MQIKLELIGRIDLGVDGVDAYYLLNRTDGDLTKQQAIDWLLPSMYHEGGGPGGYYCHTVRAAKEQHATNSVICIVQHRYNV